VTEPGAGIIRERIPTDPGVAQLLGRHIYQDERSRRFTFAARPEAETPIRDQMWLTRIPVLNQSNLRQQGIVLPAGEDALGSCTGQYGTADLATDRIGDRTSDQPPGPPVLHTGWYQAVGASGKPEPLAQRYAIDLYSAATAVDPWDGQWPPQDTGSSGLAVAKVLKARGLVASYSHCFTLDEVLAALQNGPVGTGVRWYSRMFDPDPRGRVTVGGSLSGGHQFLIIGVYLDARELVARNSWGPDWGTGGVFRIGFDDYRRLLEREDGDAIVLHLVAAAPAPGPAPAVALQPDVAARVDRLAGKRGWTRDQTVDRITRHYFHLPRP
jgi:hypothetical protein